MLPFPSRFGSILVGASALLLASCSSDDNPSRGHRLPPPKPVSGAATYFGGQLVATVRVGAEFDRPVSESGEVRTGGGGARRGGGLRFSGESGGGSFGGRPHGGGRTEGSREDDANDRPRIAPQGGVPLAIHLRIRNTGHDAAVVSATDFASPLGNFAIQPDQLTVLPGETAEFAAMTSFVRGDLPEAMPVTFVLRVAGKTDKQVLTLRPIANDVPAMNH